jgi:hypothetical protein
MGNSPYDRILGIGVAAIRLLSYQPTLCRPNTAMPIRAGAMPSRVLLTGWHEPEDWGCWTSKTTAALRLTVPGTIEAALRLELDLAIPPSQPDLTLSVNGMTLPAITPAEGGNIWDLPRKATNGRTELNLLLTVSETFNAARTGVSADDRELGIGLRGIRLIPFVSAFYEPGLPLSLGASAVLDEVLVSGWHKPEDWGCWTSGRDAALRLMLRRPVAGPFRLEMDLMDGPVRTALTVSVNGVALPALVPVAGTNRWNLPPAATDDQHVLLIGLHVSHTFSPAAVSGSPDTRTMGAGVRRLALHRAAPAACPIGIPVRISSDVADRGMLLTGWHSLEPWGCWTSGPDASMLLRFERPLRGGYALEVELAPPLLDLSVTLAVNGTELNTIFALDGPNEWSLPASCTDGQTELILRFLVPRPARPIDVTGARDDRVLGVGVRNVMIRAVREG